MAQDLTDKHQAQKGVVAVVVCFDPGLEDMPCLRSVEQALARARSQVYKVETVGDAYIAGQAGDSFRPPGLER